MYACLDSGLSAVLRSESCVGFTWNCDERRALAKPEVAEQTMGSSCPAESSAALFKLVLPVKRAYGRVVKFMTPTTLNNVWVSLGNAMEAKPGGVHHDDPVHDSEPRVWCPWQGPRPGPSLPPPTGTGQVKVCA